MKYPANVATAYDVHLLINAKHAIFTGGGYGRADEGATGVDVSTRNSVTPGFSPALLAFCLITGQADIGRCINVVNPFRSIGGAYSAKRTLTLDNGLGALEAEYTFGPIDSRGLRAAEFHISGHVNAPRIIGIRPAFETWVPNGPDKIRGHFTMAWITEGGSYLKGEVDTEYRVPGVEIEEPIYRQIAFELETSDQRLKQDEKIVVFPAKEMSRLAA